MDLKGHRTYSSKEAFAGTLKGTLNPNDSIYIKTEHYTETLNMNIHKNIKVYIKSNNTMRIKTGHYWDSDGSIARDITRNFETYQ